MATFNFTAELPLFSDEMEIPDEELDGKSADEQQGVIAKYHSEWVVDVAAGSIDGGWSPVE